MYQFNQMRRLRFLPLGLIVLMSCAREEPVDTSGLEKGEVVISLSTDAGSTDVKPQMKSVDENAPESPDDFEVEIYNSKGIRLYRDTYANSVGKKIALNTGEYRLLAQYGDSSAVSFNPSAAWYAADEQFTVNPQSTTEVSAVAKMSKVKVAVNHGPNIQADYSQYYSLVKLDGNSSKELRFEKGETRAGYIPAGKLVYELYVYNAATSKWLYCPIDAVEYKPNTFVTFNVDINKGQGTLKVSISIDDSVDEMTQEVEVPFEAAPQEKPTVTLAGFAEGNTFSFVEGVEYENVQANIVAKGRIKDCILTHESGYLTALGIPDSVNLADPELDAAVESALKSAGFKWPREVRGERFANVDFAAVPDGKPYSEDNYFNGAFTVSVTDSADYSASAAFTITQQPAVLEFAPQPYNAFAKRFKGLTASTSNGDPNLVSVQYSQDGQSWTTVSPASVADASASYDDITGLASATKYMLRAIYNGNENNVSETVELTTETEQQVGNAGFEEWTDETFSFKYIATSKSVMWYRPWASQAAAWWDSNSKKTLPGYYSTAGNQNSKNFPCVAYTVQNPYDGSKSAMMYTVRVQDLQFGKIIQPGELFIGTADEGGNHTTDGHDFENRPSALKFAYRYSPVSNENFYVKIEVKSSDGNVLASTEISDGTASENWTERSVSLNYTDISKKASTIYISFKASSAASPSWNEDVYMNIGTGDGNGNIYSSGCNIGSILYIDSLELIYE